MAANDLSFNQVATILTSIANQALGVDNLTPTNTDEFITLANRTLKAGYDPILNAISTVLTDTIFSMRPYAAKFSLMTRDKSTYGLHSRKINYIDNPVVNDDAYDPTKLVDGGTLDHWEVRKPKVIQTNFYGENPFADYITIFENQIDVAFTGVEQFREFIAGVLQNIDDKITQTFEATNRMTVVNLIGGIIASGSPNVVHLITEYKSETGNTTITSSNYKSETEFPYFSKWVVSKIEQVSSLMTERSILFHNNFNDGAIPRHTPKEYQKALFYSPALTFMRTNMLSSAFNEGDLKLVDHEEVNYWQAITSPDYISVRPSWIDADGEVVTLDENDPDVEVNNVFGIIFDVEAAGHTIFNERMDATNLNCRGLYTNLWWHYLSRWWNDFSENAVLFLMD